MQARKMFRTGLLVFGFSLWALLSLGCGGVQVSPVSISVASATINWSPDGSQIVFSRYEQGTFVVDVEGTHLHTIPPNAPIGEEWEPGSVSAALSPDGSRIAYVKVFNDGFLGRFQAEIMSARVDGTDVRRLTRSRRNDFDETSPSWSPDGRRIAFGTSASGGGDSLAIMNADGSNVLILTQRLPYFFLDDAPVWSPDGDWIGFLARLPDEENYSIQHLAIYMVRSDGTEVLDLGEAASPPAWSPDGSRIAFFQDAEGGIELTTANTDGTDRKQVLTLAGTGERRRMHVRWSPDGAALLYYELWRRRPPLGAVVRIDDGSILAEFAGRHAAWSPDGSRIAVQTGICRDKYSRDCNQESLQVALYTMARDGTDKQALVRGSVTDLVLAATWNDVSDDIAACARLHEGNPGLIEDCRTLLTIRNALARDGYLNWSADVPIGQWEGVYLEGEPLRVVSLTIYGTVADAPKLMGKIPPELGNLSKLRSLALGNRNLTGTIPPELGNLSELSQLNLQDNLLSGSIPPELGNLKKLRGLAIDGNNLSGCVPQSLSATVTDLASDGLGYCAE